MSHIKAVNKHMSENISELKKRTQAALAAIKSAYGTEDDEHGGTLFITHHLEEIESEYWEKHFKTATPSPIQIIDSLVICSQFEEGEDFDMIDLTLPDDVTNYLICVSFDQDGAVEDISMES